MAFNDAFNSESGGPDGPGGVPEYDNIQQMIAAITGANGGSPISRGVGGAVPVNRGIQDVPVPPMKPITPGNPVPTPGASVSGPMDLDRMNLLGANAEAAAQDEAPLPGADMPAPAPTPPERVSPMGQVIRSVHGAMPDANNIGRNAYDYFLGDPSKAIANFTGTNRGGANDPRQSPLLRSIMKYLPGGQ